MQRGGQSLDDSIDSLYSLCFQLLVALELGSHSVEVALQFLPADAAVEGLPLEMQFAASTLPNHDLIDERFHRIH
jgi:hypothetical protein